MEKAKVIEQIRTTRILPVIRTNNRDEAVLVSEAIMAGGINILEITMTVPDAVEVINDLAKRLGNQAVIGAGTVFDAEMAKRCLDAGAQFIVSPITDKATIELCRHSDTAVFPGAMTANEIYRAWETGADAVKVFPANALGGASYIKALKSVMPQIEIIPTGGVNLETISDFFRAGAAAVGIGSELAGKELTADIITKRAKDFVTVLKFFLDECKKLE